MSGRETYINRRSLIRDNDIVLYLKLKPDISRSIPILNLSQLNPKIDPLLFSSLRVYFPASLLSQLSIDSWV